MKPKGPIIVPRSLGEWNLPTVKRMLRNVVLEEDTFDWKEVLPPDDAGKIKLRKRIAAFANSGGGFFIYGVKDDLNLTPENRLVGLPVDLDFNEHFSAISKQIEPLVRIQFKPAPVRLENGRLLRVVEILPATRGPHGVVVDQYLLFPKRIHGGTIGMTHQEIADMFLRHEEKVAKLNLLRRELEFFVHGATEGIREASDEKGQPSNNWISVRTFSTELLERTVSEVHDLLVHDHEFWPALTRLRDDAGMINGRVQGFWPITAQPYAQVADRVIAHNTKLVQQLKSLKGVAEIALDRVNRIINA